MKVAQVLIENFRRIERLELDFTDSLDRVRPLTVLVGPNGCGKTSVLDAIGLALSGTLELPGTRTTLKLDPRRIVRRGAASARITLDLRFSDDEIAAAREAVQALGNPAWSHEKVPSEKTVRLVWEYPDPSRSAARGWTTTTPPMGWLLLKGRVAAARALRTTSGHDWLRRCGQVVTIDQRRTSLSRVIRPDVFDIIHGRGGDDGEEREGAPRILQRTSDPKTLLLDLAVRHSLRRGPVSDDPFPRIQAAFAEVCAPRKIVGAVEDTDGLDVIFHDGVAEYGFDDIASGEAMVLLLLIKLVGDRIHRSVVLVDEVELHQHPVWQRRLLGILPRLGDDNQLIVTTHSDYLVNALDHGALHRLDGAHSIVLAKLDADEGDDA